MDRLPERIELKELLQNYPSVRPGQELRAWKKLRTELYPKPDVVGLPRRGYGWWGFATLGGVAVMGCLLCWYEVMGPLGPDNANRSGSIMPASLKVPAANGDKPVIKDFNKTPIIQKAANPPKNGSTPSRPANES